MRLSITHTTRYEFDEAVSFGLQQLRKTPRSGNGQRVVDWQTHVTGGREEAQYQDHHNNLVQLLSFDRDVTELVVACEGVIEIEDKAGIIGVHRAAAPLWLYQWTTPLTQPGARLRALVRQIEEQTLLDQLYAAMRLIRAHVRYATDVTQTDWPVEKVLEEGRGVCQDHTHVFLAMARALGAPARYVSGYLRLDDRVDQVAMHAWAEAYVPDLGWVGFDVSNGISPDARYVRVAAGLDYGEAAPVTGTRQGGSGEALDVQIRVAEQ